MNSKPVAPKSPWLANRFQHFTNPYGWITAWEMLHPAGWHTEGHGAADRGGFGDMGHPPRERDGHEANLGGAETQAEAFSFQAARTPCNKSTFPNANRRRLVPLQPSRCLAFGGPSAGTHVPVPSQARSEGHGTPTNAGPMAWHEAAVACRYSDKKSAFSKHFLGRNPKFLQRFSPVENPASGSGRSSDRHRLAAAGGASLRRMAGGNARARP